MRNPSCAQSVPMQKPAPQRSQRTRINLDVMKSQIVRKLGPDRAKGYFCSLNRLLGLKISKGDFNKFCLLKFGKDFVPLHNKFVRSILHNAYNANVPPSRAAANEKGNGVVLSASMRKIAGANEKGNGVLSASARKSAAGSKEGANLPLQESDCNSVQQPVMSNGVGLSASPRKCMSSGRDGRNDDRTSPLQINGKKTDVAPHRSSAAEGETVSRENGFLRPCDLKRSGQQQQNGLAEPQAKRRRVGVTTAPDHVPVQSKLGQTIFSSSPDLVSVQQKQQNGPAEPPAKRLSTGDTLAQDRVSVKSKLGQTIFSSSPDLVSVQQKQQNGPAEPPAKRLSTGDTLAQDHVPVHSKLVDLTGEATRGKTGLSFSPCDIRGSMLPQQQKQNGPAEPAMKLCTEDVSAHAKNSVQQQHQDGPAELPASAKGHDGPAELPASAKGHVSMHASPVEVPAAVDEELAGDKAVFDARRRPILAPLGTSFSDGSDGGALGSSGIFSGCYDSGELLHKEALRNHMERIAEAQGMEGVTMASANLLNQALDCYLKRLIGACVSLQEGIKQQPYAKPVIDVLPGSMEVENELTRQRLISLHDFRVAMEINPRQLGKDWPMLLEKICFRAFEE